MSHETQITDYIAKNILYSPDGFQYDNDASFLEEGIVDSQGVMELVAFIEENFGITVDDQDITPENFDSVNKLTAYVKSKVG